MDESPLRDWITVIPFTEWPQQHPIKGQLRPAMVSDPLWHGFGEVVADVTSRLLAKLGARSSYNPLLSVVMPGHDIDPHQDAQPPEWLCRVHVPLLTNHRAWMHIGGEIHHMTTGLAYLVNTTKKHYVENRGDTPRIHFMFDVRA